MLRLFTYSLLLFAVAIPGWAKQVYYTERCQQQSAPLTKALEHLAAAIGQTHDRSGPRGYQYIEPEAVRWIAIARSQKRGYCLAELLRLFWHVRLQENKLNGSEQLLTEALEQFPPKDRIDQQRIAILSNLSYHYVLTGRFVEATQITRELIAISIELGDQQSQAANYYVVADAYLRLGEVDTARRYFQRSLDTYAPQQGTEYYATLSRLATIDRIDNEYSKALLGHTRSLKYFEIDDAYRSIPANIEIARDHLAIGDYALAEQYANAAWSDSRALLEQRIDAGLVLFDCASKRQQPNAESIRLALRNLLDEGQLSSGQRNANAIQQIEYAAASIRYFASRNDLAKVLTVADQGLALARRISADTNGSGINSMAWASRIDRLVEALASYLWDKEPRRLAQFLDEFAAVSTAPVKFGASENQEFRLLDELAKLERTLVDLQGIQPADAAKHAKLLSQLANRRDIAREAFIHAQVEHRIARQRAETSSTRDYADFKPTDGELLVRYYVRPSISIALVSSGSDLSAMRIPPLATISGMLDRAQQVIRDPNLPDVREPMRALTTLLPLPQIRSGNVKRILLVTDEATYGIPFAAIDLSEGKQLYHPLGTAFELVQVSHLDSYGDAPPRSSAARPEVVIFASPTFSSKTRSSFGASKQGWLGNLPTLDFSRSEAQVLSELLAEYSVQSFVGTTATAENLLSEQARSALILHISTHGYFRPDLAHVVGLAVAGAGPNTQETGFVSQSQLLGSPFSNALIVLASCDSLQGQRYRGIGSYGLGQALIEQGTPVVVGTLWEIPDASTAAFMPHFYRSLIASKGNTALAMKEARTALMTGRTYAHPRHWAGLTLLSRNREAERKLFTMQVAVAPHH